MQYNTNKSVNKYMEKSAIVSITTPESVEMPLNEYYSALSTDDKRRLRKYLREEMGIYDGTFYSWMKGIYPPKKWNLNKMQQIISTRMTDAVYRKTSDHANDL